MAAVHGRLPVALCVCAAIAVATGSAARAQPLPGEFVWLEQQEDSFTLLVTLNAGPDASAATAQILFNYHDERNHYEVTLANGLVQFVRVHDGEITDIGRGQTIAITGGEHLLSLRRRSWRMSLIWDNAVVCSAYDSTLSGGKVGYAATGMEVADAFVQVVPPLLWTDDFMRSANATSPWEAISGTWQQKELRTESRREEDPTRSPNAFCYHGSSDGGQALTIVGQAQQYWFWDDYSYSVAVKSQGGPAGAVFLYHDADNYLLFRCGPEADPEGARTQLISVVDGAQAVLAKAPGGIVPEQWYTLRVNVADGHIEAFLDDRPVLTAQTDALGQGQIGLYTEGEQGAYFDDVWTESWTVFRDDFAEQMPGKWIPASGEWTEPRRGTVARNGHEESLLVSGDPVWTDYVYGADVKASKRAGAGIAFRASDAGRLVFRWAPQGSGLPYAGRAQLLRVANGHTTVLGAAEAKMGVAASHRLEASCDGGHVALLVDGARVLECAAVAVLGGRIGLYADGQGRVTFDNVSVRAQKRARPAKILPRFESPGDTTMQAWATKSGQWMPGEGKAAHWHVGDFFGDKSISFEIPSVGQRSGSATIALSADPKDPQSAYRLVISTTQDDPTLQLTYYRGQERLQEGRVGVTKGGNAEVRVEHKGDHVLAYVNGQCILTQKMGR
ncbi:MAG: hypothetical protein PVH68_03050 [Armatimonadota bacterium]|jgi:hypothetical protein